MAGVDKNKINEYLSACNYTGCADYLASFRFSNPNTRRDMLDVIKNFRDEGANLQKLLQATGGDQSMKEKIMFNAQRRSGSWGTNRSLRTSYANAYLDEINALGDTKDNYLIFRLNEKAPNAFKNAIGISGAYNDDVGMGFDTNGQFVVRKDKLTQDNFYERLRTVLSETTQDTRGLGGGVDYAWTCFASDGLGGKGASAHHVDFSKVNNILDDANNTETALTKGNGQDQYVSEIMTKAYMCGAQKQIMKDYSAGRIGEDTAKWLLSQLKESYDEQLYTVALTSSNYEVYATAPNSDTMNFSLKTDSGELTELTHYLKTALQEGRVHYRAGCSGDKVGTYITIAGKSDKDGNIMDNTKAEMYLFVTGLFDEDARQVMDSDPDAKVLIKHNEHMRYKHQYDLGDGTYIDNFNEDGSAVLHEPVGANDILTPLSSDEVESYMRKEEMIKMAENRLANDDLEAYTERYKTFTKDELDNFTYENGYGLTDEQMDSVANQYATQIMYYLAGIDSEDQIKRPEDKNKINNDIKAIKNRLIKRVGR